MLCVSLEDPVSNLGQRGLHVHVRTSTLLCTAHYLYVYDWMREDENPAPLTLVLPAPYWRPAGPWCVPSCCRSAPIT